VIAAARAPASSSGLQSLQKEYPKQLAFVTLDTSDEASVKVANLPSDSSAAIYVLSPSSPRQPYLKCLLSTLGKPHQAYQISQPY